MFLADERIVPLLPKLLGKKWFDAKKYAFQPFPQTTFIYQNVTGNLSLSA